MFVSDKIVYLQVQKTGSTHVSAVLRKFCGGKSNSKHDQLKNPAKYNGKLIVSSVRNPWDWYVSLWTYGCEGHGGLYKYFTQLPTSEIRNALRNRAFGLAALSAMRMVARRHPDWASLYKDPASHENFRRWLTLLLGPEGQFVSKEGYSASPIKTVTGFMSYRFLALTTDYASWMKDGRHRQSYEAVSDFAKTKTITGRILRTETLNRDLAELLAATGYDVGLDAINALGMTNTSTHRKYNDYYDEATTRMVAERDRFIIEHYGYRFFTEGQPGHVARG